MTDSKKPANPAANRRRQRQRELEEKLKQRMASASAPEEEATAMLSVDEFVEQAKTAPVPNDQEETPLSVMPPNELEWADRLAPEEATAMLETSDELLESLPGLEPQAASLVPPNAPESSEEATAMMGADVVQSVIAAAEAEKSKERTGEHTSQLLAAAEIVARQSPRESTDMLPSADEVLEPSAVLQAIISHDDGGEAVDFPLDLLGEEPEEATRIRPAADVELQPVGEDATRMNLPVVQVEEPATTPAPIVVPTPGATGVTSLKLVLSVLAGPDINQRFLIGRGATFVGRSHDCQVVLHDLATSRQHFRIESDGAEARLIDMGSENGTLVNGHSVAEHRLERGDRITIGGTELYFSHADDPMPECAQAKESSGEEDNVWALIGIIAGIALGLATVTVAAGQFAGWWNVLGEDEASVSEAVASEESESKKADNEARTDGSVEAETPGDESSTETDSSLEQNPEQKIDPKDNGADSESVGDDPTDAAAVTALLKRCNTQLKEGAISDAVVSLEAAREAGADAEALEALSERIVQAREDQSLVESLRRALSEERWEQGLAQAERVSDDSIFQADVQKLVAQLKDGQRDAALTEAKTHVASGAWSKAQGIVDAILKDKPEHPQALRLLSTIEEGKAAADKSVETVSDSERDDETDSSQESESDETTVAVVNDSTSDAGSKSFSTAAVYRAYGSGNFDAARRRCLRAAKDDELSPEEQARAQTMARNIRSFEKEYTAGLNAVQSGNPGAAVGPFQRAIRADRRVNRSYQRKVKSALGKAYSAIAARAERSGRNYEAVKAARDALKYSPGLAEASRVLQVVDGRVSGMISQAKAGIESGRRGRSKRKLKEVLLILKVLKKRDGRAAQAKQLLDSL